MCAIVGLVRKSSKEFLKPQKDLAREMLAKMIHRGPDSSGILEESNVVLGHNRLSIVGIENGKQPISSTWTDIVVNGEFYRYDDLKRDLFPSYSWKTDSDSEILIPLYETFGIDKALELLDGEFAFILHDRRKRKLYVARDRFGIKPMSYRESSNGIEFASEVKAFVGPKSWNLDALCTSIAMHYPNLKDTVAENIFNILPGHYLEIDTESAKIINEKQWWKPNYQTKFDINLDDASRQFKALFQDSIKARMKSDAKWCVSLSGGIDSSAVLGFATAICKNPIDCFTVSFPDSGKFAWNELAIAKRTANYLGSKLHEVEMPAQKMLSYLEEAISCGEGFAVNGHVSCKCALAKAVHDAGFKTMLVGEGADECLLGYSHLKVDEFGRSYANEFMAGTETPCGDLLMKDRFQDLEYLPSFLQAKLSTGNELRMLLHPDFIDVFQKHALQNQNTMLKRYMSYGVSKAEKSVGAWLATAFPSYICKVLGDSQEMHSSVEARLPFLDKNLFEFASCLPLDFKSSTTSEKLVLREASLNMIPDEVRLRPKQPFQAPPLSALLTESQWKDFIDLCTSGQVNRIFVVDRLKQALIAIKKTSNEEQAKHESTFMLVASCAILSKKFGF